MNYTDITFSTILKNEDGTEAIYIPCYDPEEENGRGSSKGLIVDNKKSKSNKRFQAFQTQASTQSGRSDQKMHRKSEGRVRSSKRRQNMSLRNQFAELSVSYDELAKENKILKQIQKRQERELDRYTNADEDLPRLLDANSYEIAGLKAKNKQLLFDKRELDDKLRRQHQEIISLKEGQKKLQTLANNKKLGEREKLEMELTTARITVAHQENKIQDLTKAVEIYKKTAEREVRGNQLQLKKAQHNLRELQDAYNELFIKYKAKEKEAGNVNIYAQRARHHSKRGSSFKAVQSTSNITVESYNSTAKSTPAPQRTKKFSKESSLHQSSLERLESELDELNAQTDSLADLQGDLEEETKKKEEETMESRPKSASTVGSDSEDDLDATPPPKPITTKQAQPLKGLAAKLASPRNHPPPATKPFPDTTHDDEMKKREEEARIAREKEAQMIKEERRRKEEELGRIKEEERRKEEELARIKAAEEAARGKEERLKKEKLAKEAELKAKEENNVVEEKRKKDDVLKEKLAAVRKNAGGGSDDFMSQLLAKKNTPGVSPVSSVKSKSPLGPERVARKSGSSDEIRKAAVVNNNRRRKSIDEDVGSGYQPSFVARKPSLTKADPFGVDINEYTPSFSNNQRISRESLQSKDNVWTPAGRAATGERNGLFDNGQQKPLLRRRSSKQKNVIPTKVYSDEELEELML